MGEGLQEGLRLHGEVAALEEADRLLQFAPEAARVQRIGVGLFAFVYAPTELNEIVARVVLACYTDVLKSVQPTVAFPLVQQQCLFGMQEHMFQFQH